MCPKDKKRDWKHQYLSITGLRAPATLQSAKPKKEKVEIVWEVNLPTKQEMREYYKQFKGKPRFKDHRRRGGETKPFSKALLDE